MDTASAATPIAETPPKNASIDVPCQTAYGASARNGRAPRSSVDGTEAHRRDRDADDREGRRRRTTSWRRPTRCRDRLIAGRSGPGAAPAGVPGHGCCRGVGRRGSRASNGLRAWRSLRMRQYSVGSSTGRTTACQPSDAARRTRERDTGHRAGDDRQRHRGSLGELRKHHHTEAGHQDGWHRGEREAHVPVSDERARPELDQRIGSSQTDPFDEGERLQGDDRDQQRHNDQSSTSTGRVVRTSDDGDGLRRAGAQPSCRHGEPAASRRCVVRH